MDGHHLPRFLVPAVVSSAFGVGLDMIGNTLQGAYPNTPHWVWLLLFWVSIILFSGLPIWLLWHLYRWVLAKWAQLSSLRGLQFRSPLALRALPDPPSAFSSRVYQARAYAYFDQLQTNNVLRITLAFFNGTPEPVAIDSVDGRLSYEAGIGALAYPPIGWASAKRNQEPIPSLGEIFVDLEQPVPPSAIPTMLDLLNSGGRLSVELHLRIMATAMNSKTRFHLTTWQGVTCRVPTDPVVEGKIVFVTANASSETQAAQLAP